MHCFLFEENAGKLIRIHRAPLYFLPDLDPGVALRAAHVLILLYVEREREAEPGPRLLSPHGRVPAVERVADAVVRHLLRHVVRVAQCPLPLAPKTADIKRVRKDTSSQFMIEELKVGGSSGFVPGYELLVQRSWCSKHTSSVFRLLVMPNQDLLVS